MVEEVKEETLKDVVVGIVKDLEEPKVKDSKKEDDEQDSVEEEEMFEEGVDKVEDIPEGQDSKYGI